MACIKRKKEKENDDNIAVARSDFPPVGYLPDVARSDVPPEEDSDPPASLSSSPSSSITSPTSPTPEKASDETSSNAEGENGPEKLQKIPKYPPPKDHPKNIGGGTKCHFWAKNCSKFDVLTSTQK